MVWDENVMGQVIRLTESNKKEPCTLTSVISIRTSERRFMYVQIKFILELWKIACASFERHTKMTILLPLMHSACSVVT